MKIFVNLPPHILYICCKMGNWELDAGCIVDVG